MLQLRIAKARLQQQLLKRQDVHWQEDRIVAWGKGGRYGKRGKRRIVPLTARVKRLLEIRFLPREQIGLSVRTAQRIVKRVADRAMVTKPVSPHVLRHTFAVNCVQRGISTASLKKILGHDRLETTEIYLNLSPDVQALWEKDIPGYIAKADASWPRLRDGG